MALLCVTWLAGAGKVHLSAVEAFIRKEEAQLLAQGV
jgi:hypothetical protein